MSHRTGKAFAGRTAVRILTVLLLLSFPLSALAASLSFSDVPENAWFCRTVTALASDGLLHGYPDGSFRPDDPITCAEFVKLAVLSLSLDLSQGEQPLPGEKEEEAGGHRDHWAGPYLRTAYRCGIVTDADIADGSFVYDRPITRSYMAKFFCRALSLPVSDSPSSRFFKDDASVYAEAAARAGLIEGYPTDDGQREYRGYLFMTRAEAAEILYRVRSAV